jgi:hypothetical protein
MDEIDDALDELETTMGDPSIDAGPEDPEDDDEELRAVGGGLLVRLCHRAEDHFGLDINECNAAGAPARWGPVHPVHAQHSLHYAGRAADIVGPEQNMRRFARWVARKHAPKLAELIHKPGASIKNGQQVPPSFWGTVTWNAHGDHVHLAV